MKSMIIKALIEWMERGWIPESATRAGIKRLCQKRLKSLQEAGAISAELSSGEIVNETVAEMVSKALTSPIAPVPEKANEQHYEVPASFYDLVLGPRRKYSCCFFESEESTLEEAEEASLKMSCDHAEIKDGMDILELGCGWGSLTLWMAVQYPNSNITAVSNSNSQRLSILEKAKALGVSGRIDVITCDMNDFEISMDFDRVVSIEMFEHMRNYDRLLNKISDWLKPDGKLFVHIFTHKDFAYEFETDGASNWMGRYFFTGGVMPSEDLLTHFNKDLQVVNTWTWNGEHYRKTCAAWRNLMEARKQEVMRVLGDTYGSINSNRWFQRWKMFFMAGEELFGFENGRQWQVNHYLFEQVNAKKKPTDRVDKKKTAQMV